MKIRFIINPCSGRNRKRPWLPGAIRHFAATQLGDADVAITEGPRHATELAREAVRTEHGLVVAVGGDGTMNEVAQALTGTRTALALVPCGSGNGLALHLGLPRSLTAALQLIRGTGRVASIDTGIVADKPFFNAMGLGFDAEISRRFNGLTRRGLPAYVRTGLGAISALKAERCTITAGDVRVSVEALLIAIANSDQYGNNARIAPGARVDDGLLDLVVIKPANLFRLASLVPRLFAGNIDQSPHVQALRGPTFMIERAHDGIVHTDGETHTVGRMVTVQVRPRSLRILVPYACSVASEPSESPRMDFALQLP